MGLPWRAGAEPGAQVGAGGRPCRTFRHRPPVAAPDSYIGTFTPKAIAAGYKAVLRQPPGAWSWEIELRSRHPNPVCQLQLNHEHMAQQVRRSGPTHTNRLARKPR